jgi:hypothetical protein
MNTLPSLTDYAGVIHLHSSYSFDGYTPVPEIISAANARGVDFLMLTDHATLKAREDGFEGWHGRTLVIVGEEIAPRFNHYLAFQLKGAVSLPEDPPDIPPQTYIDRVGRKGGIGFIAHPDHEGTALFHVKHYAWTDWSVTGYTGLGIWDFMTDWQNSLRDYPLTVLSYAFPALFLRGPSPRTLARWDRLTQDRKVVGIGELDNHATLRRFWRFSLSIFPYLRVLRLIRTHILTVDPLTGESQKDIATLLDALRNGRSYVALDHYRSASGFSLIATDGERSATMGDDFLLHTSADLRISVPHRARLRIVRNGALVHQTIDRELSLTIREPGAYRIEAELAVLGRYRPWIFSNPIYVKRT